LLFRVFGKI